MRCWQCVGEVLRLLRPVTPEISETSIVQSLNLVAHKSASNRPVDDPSVTPRKGRSKVTNGRLLIAGVDQRSPWVRRAKDVINAHLSDLGGVDNTSAAERSIIRRAAVVTTELERLEAKFAGAGEANTADLETYQRCANTMRRLLEAVGLRRRSRDVTPSLADLLAHPYQPENVGNEAISGPPEGAAERSGNGIR
jgi:hypothetical protein